MITAEYCGREWGAILNRLESEIMRQIKSALLPKNSNQRWQKFGGHSMVHKVFRKISNGFFEIAVKVFVCSKCQQRQCDGLFIIAVCKQSQLFHHFEFINKNAGKVPSF